MNNILKFKKVWTLLLVLMLTVSITACSSNSDNEQETTGGNTNTTTSQDDSKDNENEETTLVIWTIATESDAFYPAYTQAIEDYKKNHPYVKVVYETFENESYKTKIKTAVAANDLPDIFYTWGGGFSESFVESGKVLQLDSYYTEEIEQQLPKTVLNNVTYNDKLYGVTYTTPISAIFYNKKMFEEYGLEAPETWEDFKIVCETFIENGITPISLSVKDTWQLAMLHDALTLKSAGPEKVFSALKKQGQSYNDPDFIAATKEVKELIDMGAIVDGATGISGYEANALFYNETVPMFITGSWMSGNIQTNTENPEDFDVVPIPVLNSDNAKITDFMGGAADTLMVSASTKNPDIAVEAAFEISKKVSEYSYKDGAGIPAWKIDYDDSSVNPITKKIAEYAADATSFTLWFDTLMAAEDAGEYLALLQELYIGNITPEEFAENMAKQLEK